MMNYPAKVTNRACLPIILLALAAAGAVALTVARPALGVPLVFVALIGAAYAWGAAQTRGQRHRRRSLTLGALVAVVAVAVALLPTLAGAATSPISVLVGPRIANSSSNAGIGCDEMYLRAVNAVTPLLVCAQTKRPDEGGGQRQVALFTADGIIGVYDLAGVGYVECFGARPWASRFSNTVKIVANCRAENTGNGNDREPVFFDTGIPAEPLR